MVDSNVALRDLPIRTARPRRNCADDDDHEEAETHCGIRLACVCIRIGMHAAETPRSFCECVAWIYTIWMRMNGLDGHSTMYACVEYGQFIHTTVSRWECVIIYWSSRLASIIWLIVRDETHNSIFGTSQLLFMLVSISYVRYILTGVQSEVPPLNGMVTASQLARVPCWIWCNLYIMRMLPNCICICFNDSNN